MPKNSRQEIARQRAAASLDEVVEEDEALSEEEQETSSRKGSRRGSHSEDVNAKRPRVEPTATTLFSSPPSADSTSIRGNGGSSNLPSSSSKVQREVDTLTNSMEDEVDDNYFRVITLLKCKVSTELFIESQLNLRDLLIDTEGAHFVLRMLNGLSKYHYTLEYDRCSIKINLKDYRLDKHLYIYIHYLLYLLSEEGLEYDMY